VFGARLLSTHVEQIAIRGPGVSTPWHAPGSTWSIHTPSRVYRAGLVRRYASETVDGSAPKLGPHGDGADAYSLLPLPAPLQVTAGGTAAATATTLVEGASYGVSSVFSTVSSAFFGPGDVSTAQHSKPAGQSKSSRAAGAVAGAVAGGGGGGGGTGLSKTTGPAAEVMRRVSSGRGGRPRTGTGSSQGKGRHSVSLRRQPSNRAGIEAASGMLTSGNDESSEIMTPEEIEAAHFPPIVAALVPADIDS